MLTGFAQIIFHFCLGVFEANAIQFGVDQLHFTPSDELSRFVHWYYWSTCAFQEILVLGLMHWRLGSFIVMVWISCGSVAVALVIIHCSSKGFVLEPVGRANPIKHIINVLRYARQHTAPVFRSAFTYGEGPPSRLDLAKERYGGPYTTEQVEDVKSFGHILLVLLSSFGICWSLLTIISWQVSLPSYIATMILLRSLVTS